jgi:hypothetical protein
MSAVIIYTVVIKEGAIPKLLEMLLIVLVGCKSDRSRTSNRSDCRYDFSARLRLLFPTSATSRLQNSISKSIKSFSTLLDLLASTFLLEKATAKEDRPTLKEAAQSHSSALKTLKTDLAEAKHERVFDPRIRGRKLKLYDAAIASLGRLAQHLSGMRSGTRLQETLIRVAREGRLDLSLALSSGIMIEDDLSKPLADVSIPHLMLKLPEKESVHSSIQLFVQFRDIAGEEMNRLVVSGRLSSVC